MTEPTPGHGLPDASPGGAVDTITGDPLDESRLFGELCELDTADCDARLRALATEHPALAARLRRLLAIDDAYAGHTARNVMAQPLHDPVDGLADVGPFRLVRLVGRGGMGVVYEAERRSGFAQRVAIKLLPRFAADPAARERFARERAILARLRHPNICSILDGDALDDGTPWLAMEFVPGEPLCAWCAHRGTDLRGRIDLFLQLCDAVQAAHRSLVIHRDLKDGNVLVDETGHLKLLDFGIAKALTPAPDETGTLAQDRFFSPMTAAPEQLRGDPALVATDVYALGALLHQLLCGELPFERPPLSPAERTQAILERVPPRASDTLQRAIGEGRSGPSATGITPAMLRGELDAIVAHCLRKDADERYADVGDLARDLRAWRSGHPIAIAQGDRLYRTRKFLRRHRLPATIAALALAGVLAALGVALWQAAELRVQRDQARAARAQSEADRDRARVVAAFMRDTFEQADPGKAREDTLMARDLVAHGKRRLGDLDGQPDTQADLALLMAENEAGLGLLQDSAATYAAYAPGIEALARKDADVRWRAASLQLSIHRELDPDTPTLDAHLAALASLADTPTRRARVAHERERLYARRAAFAAAARTLEDAWRTLGRQLPADDALRLRIDLGDALLNAERTEDAARLVATIDFDALRRRDPAQQIRAWRLMLRELDARKAPRAERMRAIDAWRDTAVRYYGADSLEAANAYVWAVGVSDDPATQERLMQRAHAIQTAKLPLASMARAYAERNMAGYYLELRGSPALAEPYLALAVTLGRRATSRAHGDVRGFELQWARTLNALGRHARCLEALSSPPAAQATDTDIDAAKLSGLDLELAKAALATGRRTDAARLVTAAYSVWDQRHAPFPAAQADTLAQLQRRLAMSEGRR